MKRRKESYTEQVHIITQAHLNGYSRLFGGQLMSWIDEVAGVVARRHSGKNVTTALIDMLSFKKPAYINDIIVLEGELIYTGKTSMEVRVRTYIEPLDNPRIFINEAYVVMVALDNEEKPTEVKKLITESEEEKRDFEAAKRRKARRAEYI